MAKHRSRTNKQEPKTSAPSSLQPYQIRLTDTARLVYEEMYDRAEEAKQRGDLANQHITDLRMVDEVIEKIIPHDPFGRRYALTDDLPNIFRMQKGRIRVMWMGSSQWRLIYVLFISNTPRKAGDVNDPYRIFTSLVMSGKFDHIFDGLGVKRPGRERQEPVIPQ